MSQDYESWYGCRMYGEVKGKIKRSNKTDLIAMVS